MPDFKRLLSCRLPGLKLLTWLCLLTCLSGAAVYADEQCQNTAEQGINDCTYIIKKHPYYQLGYIRRGLVYEHQGAIEKAIADYTKGINLCSSKLDLYRSRARLRTARSNRQSNCRLYEGHRVSS
jgi:tetratricopeptide (TPR) repeat protein